MAHAASGRGLDDLAARPNQTWNVWAFVLDMAMFTVAMSFISTTTVLPTFIGTLTDSEVIVGLAGGLTSGAWLLPQLAVASAVSRLPRKKPLMVRAAWVSRPFLVLLAIFIALFGRTLPELVLAVTLLTITLFFMIDAMVSIPWFDILARAFPHRIRGRVLGASQVVGAIGGIGAGVVVRYVLSEASPFAYPGNYASLFALAGIAFILGAVALCFIREPDPTVSQEQAPTIRQAIRSLPDMLVRDRAFRWLSIVRVLSGFVAISSTFFVLHATRNLGFAPEDAGLFVSAQVLGSLASGLLMGVIPDRWGPLKHIRTVIAVSAVPPLLALAAGPLSSLGGQSVMYLYLLLYFSLGIYTGSLGLPYFNWIFEHAEETRRPLYIGLSNTVTALVMLAPTLGGWIIRVMSYEAAFVASLGVALAALALSTRVPDTRKAT